MHPSQAQTFVALHWAERITLCLLAYAFSSGPVMAAAFKLRDLTGWNGFYGVMWVYLPLIWPGHWQPFDAYLEWWVKLLGTVGPG